MKIFNVAFLLLICAQSLADGTPTKALIYFQVSSSNRWYYRDAHGDFYTKTNEESKWKQVEAKKVLSTTSNTETVFELGGNHGFLWHKSPDRVLVTKDSTMEGGYNYEFIKGNLTATLREVQHLSTNWAVNEPPGPRQFTNSMYQNTLFATGEGSPVCDQSGDSTLICGNESVAVCVNSRQLQRLTRDNNKDLRAASCWPYLGSLTVSHVANQKERSPATCVNSPPCYLATSMRIAGSPVDGADFKKLISDKLKRDGIDDSWWHTKWQNAYLAVQPNAKLPNDSGSTPGGLAGNADAKSITGPNPVNVDVSKIHIDLKVSTPQVDVVQTQCKESDNQFKIPDDAKTKTLPHCWKAVECASAISGKAEQFWMEAQEANTGKYSEATRYEVDKNCAGPVSLVDGSGEQITDLISKSNGACLNQMDWNITENVCPAGDNRPKGTTVANTDSDDSPAAPSASQGSATVSCTPSFPDASYENSDGCSKLTQYRCLPKIRNDQLKSCKNTDDCTVDKCIEQYEGAISLIDRTKINWDINKIRGLYKDGDVADKSGQVVTAIGSFFEDIVAPQNNTKPIKKNSLINKCLVQWSFRSGVPCTLSSQKKNLSLDEIAEEFNKFSNPDAYLKRGVSQIDLKRFQNIESEIGTIYGNRKGLTVFGFSKDSNGTYYVDGGKREYLSPDIVSKLTTLNVALRNLFVSTSRGLSFFNAVDEAKKEHIGLPIISFKSNPVIRDEGPTLSSLKVMMGGASGNCLDKGATKSVSSTRALFSRDYEVMEKLKERLTQCQPSSGKSDSDGSQGSAP